MRIRKLGQTAVKTNAARFRAASSLLGAGILSLTVVMGCGSEAPEPTNEASAEASIDEGAVAAKQQKEAEAPKPELAAQGTVAEREELLAPAPIVEPPVAAVAEPVDNGEPFAFAPVANAPSEPKVFRQTEAPEEKMTKKELDEKDAEKEDEESSFEKDQPFAPERRRGRRRSRAPGPRPGTITPPTPNPDPLGIRNRLMGGPVGPQPLSTGVGSGFGGGASGGAGGGLAEGALAADALTAMDGSLAEDFGGMTIQPYDPYGDMGAMMGDPFGEFPEGFDEFTDPFDFMDDGFGLADGLGDAFDDHFGDGFGPDGFAPPPGDEGVGRVPKPPGKPGF